MQQEKQKIQRKIGAHIQDTRRELLNFVQQFEKFKKVSLPTKAELLARKNQFNKDYIDELIYKSEQEGNEEYIWDRNMILEYVENMEKLNADIEKVEKATRVINKRQEALGVKMTDFPELFNLKTIIKPQVQLWETI